MNNSTTLIIEFKFKAFYNFHAKFLSKSWKSQVIDQYKLKGL